MNLGGDLPNFGHYRTIRKIGRGGQGDVYLAHDPHLDIDVAIKVLHPEYREPEFVGRLMLEARIMVRLAAPNIVRVYNLNPKYPYLVMEYCGDGDLNQLIKSRRPQPLTRWVSLVRQICDALIVAHEHDDPVLHRDLKPANVLFHNDIPKVADFGLAKVLGGATSGLTMSRGMMGTVGYSSPEQLKDASRVDHRTDLWAVGVILYELLTFRGPFEKPGDDDFVNTAIRVRTEPPADPPCAIPAPLWDVIIRALDKRPEGRFASAREMARALDDALAAIPGADQILMPDESVLGDVDRFATRVADSLGSGSLEDARSHLEQMRKISPEDSLVRYWERKLREVSQVDQIGPDSTVTATEFVDSRLGAIRKLLSRREFGEARRECGKILIDYPDDSSVHDMLQTIGDEERVLAQTMNQARSDSDRARGQGEIARVIEIWRGMDERFPEHPDIRAELAVADSELKTIERRKAWEEKEQKLQDLVNAGELFQAVELLDSYLSHHPEDSQAASMRGSIHGRLAEQTQIERLELLRSEAHDLRAKDLLDRALALWKLILDEVPTDEEAHREAETLRREIGDRKRRAAIDEATSRANERVEVGDLSGALRIWREALAEIPGDAEVRGQVEHLEKQIAERRESAMLHELKEQLSSLESRIAGGRFGSVPGASESIPSAVKAARAGLSGNVERLAVAMESLTEAELAAETELTAAIQANRLEVRSAIDQASEVLGDPVEAGRLTAAESALDRALGTASLALCEVRPSHASGDPVEALVEAGTGVHQAADLLVRERQEAIDQARTRASALTAKAGQALEALETIAVDAASEEPTVSGFADRLTRLKEGVRSSSGMRLGAVALAARELREEIDAATATLLWRLSAELRDLLDRAFVLLATGGSDRLRTLAQSAAATLDAEETDVASMVALRQELRAEVETSGEAQAAARSRAEDQWRVALGEAERLDEADLPADLQRKLKTIRESGESALAASGFDDVERHSTLLAGLARRARLEKAWATQREAVQTLEGPADESGLTAGPSGAEARHLLGRIREALARGAVQDLAGLGREAREQRSTGPKRDERAGKFEVPDLDAKVRRLNERDHPAALERFDREVTAYRRARSDGDRSAVDARASAVERSHAALLRPAPAWPRWVAVVAVVAVIAIVAVKLALPTPAVSSVTLVSPSGEVRVTGVSQDGRDVTGRVGAGTVTAAGVDWELDPGSYIVTTEHGAEVSFDAPRRDAVFVPGPSPDHSRELMRELDLEELIGTGEN